jgi:hypothetical protein
MTKYRVRFDIRGLRVLYTILLQRAFRIAAIRRPKSSPTVRSYWSRTNSRVFTTVAARSSAPAVTTAKVARLAETDGTSLNI